MVGRWGRWGRWEGSILSSLLSCRGIQASSILLPLKHGDLRLRKVREQMHPYSEEVLMPAPSPQEYQHQAFLLLMGSVAL